MAANVAKSRIPAPRTPFQRFLARPFVFDLFLALCALLGTVASAIRAFATGKDWDTFAAWLFLVGGLVAILFGIGKFLVLLASESEKESTHDFDACLMMLHTLVTFTLPEADRKKMRLRFAVHRPEGEFLTQVTNYIGDNGASGGAGRKFNIQAGIIGLAIENNKCMRASRDSENYFDYLSDLQTTWKYTEREAKQRNPIAMSWVAIPVCDPIEGVLYGDSTLRNFFDDPNVLELVTSASVAIARLLDERY